MGAHRGQLIRSVLAEGLLLAAAGGALGLALAHWGTGAIVALAPSTLAFMSRTIIELDGRVLVVAALTTGAVGLLFALGPALRASRPDVEATLRGAGTPTAARRSLYGRVPGALVVTEIALSLVLLVGTALMARTLANLESIDPGFDPGGLVSMEVALPTDRYFGNPARARFFDELSQRLVARPGVIDVATSWSPPPSLGGITFGTPETESGPVPGVARLTIPNGPVSNNYFRTLGIALLEGREFAPGDPDDLAVVSRELARRLWPAGGALGKRFRLGSNMPWYTVVGIAGDVVFDTAGDERTTLAVYHPWVVSPPPPDATPPARRSYSARTVIIRAQDPQAIVPVLKQTVSAIDPKQPVGEIALVEDVYGRLFARQRFVLWLMSAFAGVALALAAAGIFAVLSQVVAQRTREIGIRVALGARPADILNLVLSRGMALTAIGAFLGTAGALALTRFLGSLMYEVSPHDPISFAAVVALVALVALAACIAPTSAAMRVEPAKVLRTE